MKRTKIFILGLLLLLLVPPASRAVDQRLALAGGGGVWLDPEQGMHFMFLGAYDLDDLAGGMSLGFEYNTDTARLRLEKVPLLPGRLEAFARAAYEFKFAGLLIDYYRQGSKLPERGFEAGYLELAAGLKALLPADNYLALTLGVRRWFVGSSGSTDPALVLPAAAWVFEPRLEYTFWRLQSDVSLRDRHRLFPRIRGLALGVSVGLDWRSRAHPWGALDAQVFDRPDTRNRPGQVIFLVRQWLRAGWQLHPRLRAQLAQFASFGHGEDDLTRVRLGGLNPYVVPLAGAPWAAWLSGKFLWAESSWHLRVWGGLEAGLLLQAALVEDSERAGRQDVYGLLAGLGAFVDWQLGDFQIDFRAGWTPSLDARSEAGQFGLFFSGGWQWD